MEASVVSRLLVDAVLVVVMMAVLDWIDARPPRRPAVPSRDVLTVRRTRLRASRSAAPRVTPGKRAA